MKFSDTVKHEDPHLVITKQHEQWMLTDGEYSEEARQFLADQLVSKPRERRGTVSASSLGDCKRKQQFTFLGIKERTVEARGRAIFANGNFMHYRWQMSGISQGWLSQAEVPVPPNDQVLSGTMDGVLYNDDIVEFKSINDNGYRGISTFGVQKKHLMQGAAYALASDRANVVFIYENKNNQEYTEVVVGREDLPLREAETRALDLRMANSNQVLEEPLSKCYDKEGFDYTYCPFRDMCLGTKDWDDAVRQARS